MNFWISIGIELRKSISSSWWSKEQESPGMQYSSSSSIMLLLLLSLLLISESRISLKDACRDWDFRLFSRDDDDDL